MVAQFVEEIVEPEKNIPLVAFTGVPAITLLYVLLNLVCLTSLSQNDMASSTAVISTYAECIGGKIWRYIIPLLICMIWAAAQIGTNYGQSRFLMSASREGQFPTMFGLIHKNKRTPIPALLYICFAGTIMILCYGQNLEALILNVNILYWIEYGLVITTLIVFRYRKPNVVRPYKVWITTPIFMICVATSLVILSLINQALSTIIVIAIMLSGIPVYYICVKRKRFSFLQLDRLTRRIINTTGLVECQFDNTVE